MEGRGMERHQSAPRVIARGDAVREGGEVKLILFQSAPRVIARGDINNISSNSPVTGFNPRPA